VSARPRAAVLVAALCAAARIAHAECPEGTPQAACVLHEEGVAALTAARYDEAATKFRAAIASSPSARSYLGYSQAVEGQGKLALAYETMLSSLRSARYLFAGPGSPSYALQHRQVSSMMNPSPMILSPACWHLFRTTSSGSPWISNRSSSTPSN